jgi:hypothetical protein
MSSDFPGRASGPACGAFRRRRRLAPLRLILLTGLVFVAVAATSASATPTASSSSPSSASGSAKAPSSANKNDVTFGAQPASLRKSVVAPDSRPYFYYGVTPGSSLTDHIAILNYSTKPLTLNIYATDALNTDAGGFGLLDASKKPTDAGSWVSVGSHIVTVPARTIDKKTSRSNVGSVVLPLTLRIPANASPGDHVAGVVASLDSIGKNAKGANVRLDQRVGSRMFIRVAGPLHPNLSVENLHVVYHASLNPLVGGSATLTYTVHNRGNVKLGARQQAGVRGLFGLSSQASKMPDIPLLLPGNSVRQSVTVQGVIPQIQMTASVTLIALKLPGDVDGPIANSTASVHFWAWPWLPIAVVVLLIIGGWIVARKRRRSGGSGRGHGGRGHGGHRGGPPPITELPTSDDRHAKSPEEIVS